MDWEKQIMTLMRPKVQHIIVFYSEGIDCFVSGKGINRASKE